MNTITMTSIKVLVVDDHPLARKGIMSILSVKENIDIIETSNVKEALYIIEKNKINVAIIDLKLGSEDGLEVVVEGKKISHNTKYIILTSFISGKDIQRAEKIGVDGYILKEAMAEDILFALNSVIRGKKYYDPSIVTYYTEKDINKGKINQLSLREKEVLCELCKGFSNEKIAEVLFISVNTVKKHISSILSKLNLEHRTQVALYAKTFDRME